MLLNMSTVQLEIIYSSVSWIVEILYGDSYAGVHIKKTVSRTVFFIN